MYFLTNRTTIYICFLIVEGESSSEGSSSDEEETEEVVVLTEPEQKKEPTWSTSRSQTWSRGNFYFDFVATKYKTEPFQLYFRSNKLFLL